MVIHTNSPKVRQARKTNIELILSQHDFSCAICVRSGNCSLQKIANDLGITEIPYKKVIPHSNWNKNFPLIKDYEKCIKCMRCIQICDKVQRLNIWDVSNTGSRTTVDISLNRKIEDADCSLCGQCITHCPVGALKERADSDKVFEALADPDKITIVQVAPAVRTAWGETIGIPREKATAQRLVAALKRMGFDYIFDTNFSADLTIMEEASEFIEKFKSGNKKTMFTSCCPAWVRFMKSQYPDMVDRLSTSKSPQQMFGAIVKSYYAELLDVEPSKIFFVSIMPCVAKKHEAEIKTINGTEGIRDVDAVLTTREIDKMISADHIKCEFLKEEEFDLPFGIGSGAGAIFGASGGVMEAALRTAYYMISGKNPEPDAFKAVRGINPWKEMEFDLNGISLKVAVASGLANARNLIKAIKKGKVKYDFVEIMACPGGCSGGGGQPINIENKELAEERAKVLYDIDSTSSLRFSHENPAIIKCYKDYLQKPLSHRSHQLLHTDHNSWEMPLKPQQK